MKKKPLIITIIVLAVVLAACLIALLVMDDPHKDPGAQQNPVVQQPEKEDLPTNGEAEETKTPEATDGADPQATEGAEPTEKATEATEEVTEPTGPLVPNVPTDPDVEVPQSKELDYLKYHSMSGEAQAAFINSFDSYEAFFAWYNKVKAEYENSLVEIDGSTPVNAEDLVGGN